MDKKKVPPERVRGELQGQRKEKENTLALKSLIINGKS
jgi:hypothetical protein